MAGVMSGRRLKFCRDDRNGEERYEVAAVQESVRVDGPSWVLLGHVVRGTRSTDSRIAGTRMRREGKGAVVWTARVPSRQWEGGRTVGLPARELQGCMDHSFRLEWRGETWDRREDAALALAAWYDQRKAAAG